MGLRLLITSSGIYKARLPLNSNLARASRISKMTSHSGQSSRSLSTTASRSSITAKYPGLGLPLRHNEQDEYGFYPIGAHGSCYGSDSDIITVRELAMMDIMDKLTDKEHWHEKVFNEEIVAKWRKEALAIPDEALRTLSTQGKRQRWPDDGPVEISNDYLQDTHELQGIIDEDTFKVVRHA